MDYDRVALAAFMGHEGARLALPDNYFTCEAHKADTIYTDGWIAEQLVRDLKRWGIHAQARAALALGRRVFSVWINGQIDNWASDLRRYPMQCFRAAEEWIVCPCKQHLDKCEEVVHDSQITVPTAWQWSAAFLIAHQSYKPTAGAGVPHECLTACIRSTKSIPFDHNGHRMREGKFAPGVPIVDDKTTCLYEDTLKETLRKALIPWALNESDPVKERVDGRG
jgi:hypothetical protein